MVAKAARPGAMLEGRFAGAGGSRPNAQTIAGRGGRFIDVSMSVPASVHGMKAFRQKADRARLGRFGAVLADQGHAGAEKAPHTNTEAAAKRPPGGKLADQDIARNRRISSKRFVVERGNALIKSHGIVNKMRWCNSEKLSGTIRAVCGPINFRTVRRKKHPANCGRASRPRRPPVSDPRSVRPEIRTAACRAVPDAGDGQCRLALLCYWRRCKTAAAIGLIEIMPGRPLTALSSKSWPSINHRPQGGARSTLSSLTRAGGKSLAQAASCTMSSTATDALIPTAARRAASSAGS